MLEIFLVIQDADGDKSRVTFNIDETSTGFLSADDVVLNIWNIVNPLLNGTLISAGYSVEVSIAGFTNAVANVLSDVQEAAQFIFRSAEGFISKITLPTFIETFFTGSGAGKTVDTTATEIVAFKNMVTTGVPITGNADDFVDVTTSHGESIASLDKARESWGKRRR